MDNAFLRPRYPRRSVGRKRRKQLLLMDKMGQTFMKQTFAAVILMLTVIGLYNANTGAAKFINKKIEWVATYNINLSDVYSSLQDTFKKLAGIKETPGNHGTENTLDAADEEDEILINGGAAAYTDENTVNPPELKESAVMTPEPGEEAVLNTSVLGAVTFAKPVSGTIVTPFGTVKMPFSEDYIQHNGIDIEVEGKAYVHAVLNGEVVEVGRSREYGNFAVVKHDNQMRTVYAHCTKINVQAGDRVSEGDVVAVVESINSIPAHLHFEVWIDNNPVNPETYIDQVS